MKDNKNEFKKDLNEWLAEMKRRREINRKREEVEVKDFRSGDHEGHEWLTVEFVDGSEFISYDDGISWQEME